LARLRGPERLALTLHYINGYSQAEIGTFLGVGAGTVKGRLARARRRLREEVMQMVEEVFDQHTLPPEFGQDVIRAVNHLLAGLRAALPPDLDDVSRHLHRRSNQSWRAVLAKVPETLLPRPLATRGEASSVPVAALPKALQQEAQAATCLMWFDWVVHMVNRAMPWVNDFDLLRVRFYEQGDPCVSLGDGSGYNLDGVPIGADARSPRAEEKGTAVDITGICSQPPELRGMFRELRRAIPGRSGSLGDAMYAAMTTLMRQARDLLPTQERKAMVAGKSVSVKDLPEPVRELLRKAVHLYRGSYVLGLIEGPPTWLTRFTEGTVEFGVYSAHADLPKAAHGQEYIELCGPEGRSSQFMTGIGEVFDAWPNW